MTEALAKQAFKDAEKTLRDEQVETVKKIVLETLKKLSGLEKERKELDEQIKILKMDVADLKEGRVDRVAERQEKDEKAKKTSVVVIIKEKEVIREVSPWYFPYQVIWQVPTVIPTYPPYTITCNSTSGHGYSCASSSISTISCSAAKFGTVGAYELDNKVVNLR